MTLKNLEDAQLLYIEKLKLQQHISTVKNILGSYKDPGTYLSSERLMGKFLGEEMYLLYLLRAEKALSELESKFDAFLKQPSEGDGA